MKVLILKHEKTNIVVKPLPNFEERGEMNEIEYIGKLNRVKDIFCKRKPFTWPTHVQKYFYYFWKHLLTSQHHHTLWKTGTNSSQSDTLPQPSQHFLHRNPERGFRCPYRCLSALTFSTISNACYLIQPNKSRNQFTYLIKDTTLD